MQKITFRDVKNIWTLVGSCVIGAVETIQKKETPIDQNKPTLVYLHGLSLSAFAFTHLRDYFEGQGYNFIVFNYWPKYKHNEIMQQLTKGIKELSQTVGKPVGVLGYSRGGILATAVAQHFARESKNPVSAVACLATPLKGSPYAKFGLKMAKEIRPGNQVLKEILSREINVPSLYLAGEKDEIVPLPNSLWPEENNLVTNTILPDTMHASFVKDEKAFGLVNEFMSQHLCK